MPMTMQAALYCAGGFALCFFTCLFLGVRARGPARPSEGAKHGLSKENLGAALACATGLLLFTWGMVSIWVATIWVEVSYVPFPVLGLVLLLFIALAGFLPFGLGFSRAQKFAGAADIVGVVLGALGATLGAVLALPAVFFTRKNALPDQADLTEEAVLQAVDTAEEQDVIDEGQKEMIENIFELDDVYAGDAMTHRTEVIAVEAATPAIDALRLAVEEGFSRMPVYRKTLDDIVGILFVKDLLPLVEDPALHQKPASELCRTAMFVPESFRVHDLIQQFRDSRTQIAIVVDEYGGTSGLVTMEDMLEEIVGDMQDEFDDEEELITANGEGFICSGSADLEDLLEKFGIEIPDGEEPDFDSVGGLVTELIGRIPEQGEDVRVEYLGILFTVLEAGERRILKLACERVAGESEDAKGE